MVKGLQCLTHSLTGQTNIWLFVRPMALLTHWCWTKPAQMPETQMSSLSLSSTEDETLHHQSMCICLIKLLPAATLNANEKACVCQPLFLFRLAAVWWWNGALNIRQKGALVLQSCSAPPWSPLFLRAPHNGDLPEGGNVAFLGLWAHIP